MDASVNRFEHEALQNQLVESKDKIDMLQKDYQALFNEYERAKAELIESKRGRSTSKRYESVFMTVLMKIINKIFLIIKFFLKIAF